MMFAEATLGSRQVEDVLGTWRLCATTFPFFLTPNRTDVVYRYSLHPTRERYVVNEISYLYRGRRRGMKGVCPPPSPAGVYRWRGRGALIFMESIWSFKPFSGGDMGVIRYGATVASHAGVHIVAREGVDTAGVPAALALEARRLESIRGEFDDLVWLR